VVASPYRMTSRPRGSSVRRYGWLKNRVRIAPLPSSTIA
jgi:hypothetical protein